MVKKHKQLAAAGARAARWKNKPLVSITCPTAGAQPPSPPSAYYTSGGINFHQSDDEYELNLPSGREWSDDESLCELEGDDLEENLRGLRVGTLLDKLSQPKTSAVWKKVEQNRSLGYNGLSSRTQRRRDKMARDQTERRKEMKMSDNPQVAFITG